MGQSATEAHPAIGVRKQIVKVPPMKLKFGLQMTRWHTRPRDEDTVVVRSQSLVANLPSRPLSCLLLLRDEGVSGGALHGNFASGTR